MSGEEMWKYCTGEQCRDLLRSLDLLRGTGVKQEQEIACLYSLANHAEAHYRRARIPKKNGGVRKLQIPDGMMKKVQRNLLHHVLDGLEPSPYATAYRKGAGLKENAAPHTGKRQILKLDLENFFENITFSLILENVFSSRVSAGGWRTADQSLLLQGLSPPGSACISCSIQFSNAPF